VKIFTADKIQLRQNIARSGNRTLAMDMKPGAVQKLAAAWGRNIAFVLNAQQSQRKSAEQQAENLRQAEALRREELERQAKARRQATAMKQAQAKRLVQKSNESVKPAESIRPTVKPSESIRQRIEILRQKRNQQRSRGMRI
jgi:hypothetical protein